MTTSKGDERKVARLFRSLEPADQRTLLAFAEFLAERGHPPSEVAQGALEPELLPRPKKESVVGAIKRLSRSYYMLDRSAMLNDTSSLMGAHVLRGRPAAEVIDELEALFIGYYAKYREENERERT
ncbi:MAG: hypothetical protein U9Q81_06170 [Pseudomonadota bacterium]|nr:hypothetical protein [Pseudomonadota bacterium]